MNPLPPRIDVLGWDDWNLGHITKHDVTPQEVEEVITGNPIFRASYKNRLAVTGPTVIGRMLTTIIGESPRVPHQWYVCSARPASRKERHEYVKHMEH